MSVWLLEGKYQSKKEKIKGPLIRTSVPHPTTRKFNLKPSFNLRSNGRAKEKEREKRDENRKRKERKREEIKIQRDRTGLSWSMAEFTFELLPRSMRWLNVWAFFVDDTSITAPRKLYNLNFSVTMTRAQFIFPPLHLLS